MSQHYGWFEAFKNEDGTISAAIPKEWPQDVKDNFEKSVDLWVARGSAIERERIIKLLESDPKEMLYWGGGLRAGYETAIALIKGEN